MPALKLSMAAVSFYTKPYKWARTITTSTTTTTTTNSITPHCSLSLSLALNNNPRWRNVTPCARLPSLSYNRDNNSNNNNNNKTALGFAFRGHNHKYFSLVFRNASSSSSSTHKTGSDSSGSGLVADMGSENKIDDIHWYQDGHLNGPNQSPSPSVQNHKQHSKILTLPTVLTLGRVAAVPLLVCTFYVDSWWGRTATTSIFIAAAITDWLDGYLARKMRLGSAFGAFLDPVADKLMVAATLVLLCTRPLEVAMFGQVPWLLTVPSIAIIGREITMSAVREWAASQNGKLSEAVAVNNLGKWKTATQMTALTILLATRDSSLGGPGILIASGVVLLYISAGLSVWSLAVYMSKIWRVLLK